MSSSVETETDLSASVRDVEAAIRRVIADNRYKVREQSTGEGVIEFVTRKTMFTYELLVSAAVVPAGQGSRLRLALDTAPGRPKALLDKKKNQKAAQKILTDIQAALGVST